MQEAIAAISFAVSRASLSLSGRSLCTIWHTHVKIGLLKKKKKKNSRGRIMLPEREARDRNDVDASIRDGELVELENEASAKSERERERPERTTLRKCTFISSQINTN